MRLHKEGFDALVQTRIEELTNNFDDIDHDLLMKLITLRQSPSSDTLDDVINTNVFKSLVDAVLTATGTHSQMTINYLKDVSTMLAIVSAVREGDLKIHLQAERQMLKLIFAFDHIHYARYNTFQHVNLLDLQRRNTSSFQDLYIYGYGATSTGDPFSVCHGDLVTEHMNRETKGVAGPFRSGYSTNYESLNKWVMTCHIYCKLRIILRKKMRIMTSSVHKELTPGNKRLHNSHVTSLKNKLAEYNVNPFGNGPARSLSTGCEVDVRVINDLLDAEQRGNAQYTKFVKERLVEGKQTIFDTITKVKLKTGNEKKKIVPKAVSVLKEDRQAFGLLIAKSAKLEEAFQHPITSLPLSIATPKAELYQSDKAGFRNFIIQESDSSSTIHPLNAKWIIDGMAAVQSVKPKETYEEWFKMLIQFITPPNGSSALSIDIIMDTYLAKSVKEGTRRHRGGNPGPRTFPSGFKQKMPQGEKWLAFLSNTDNKNDLISLFVKYLKTPEVRNRLKLPMIVTETSHTWSINREGCKYLFDCNHEEADTRIVLHASLAEENVVVVAKDTDVLVLLVSEYSKLLPTQEWVMKYDTNKYTSISKITKYLGPTVSNNISRFHAITGCDTTSYFFRVGKIAPFKKILKQSDLISLISELGKQTTVDDMTIERCMRFIQIVLYAGKKDEGYVDTRIRLYKKQTQKSSMSLPPDPLSCKQAIKRANYQSYFWTRCSEKNLCPPSFEMNGWIYDSESEIVKPIWYDGQQFPPSMRTKGKRNMEIADGYEADKEEHGYSVPRKKKVKRNKDISEKSPEQVLHPPLQICFDEEIEVYLAGSESDDDQSVEDKSEWERLSDFSNESDVDSDSSNSDWMP